MKTIEKNDDVYVCCENLEELTTEVAEMGFASLETFLAETGATTEELIGNYFTLVHNRIFFLPKAKPSKPEVCTDQYEFSHDRKPKGRGGWAFATSKNPKSEDIYWARATVTLPHHSYETTSLTYSEAKKAAQEHFRGEAIIYVLS